MFEESVPATPSIWTSMNSWFTPTVLFVLLNVMIGTIAITSSLANQKQQREQQQQNQAQEESPQQPNMQLARSPSLLQRIRSINLSGYRTHEPVTSPFKSTSDSDTHFLSAQIHQDFQLNHQEQALQTETQYGFDPTHKQNAPEIETQYVFQQNASEMETQYVFQQTHEPQITETESQYVVEQAFEEEEEEEEEGRESQTLDEVYGQVTDHQVTRTKSDTKPTSGEVPTKLPAKIKKSASMKSAFGHFEEEDIVEVRRPATVRERTAKVTEVDDEVDARADDFINKFKQQLKLQRIDSIIRYKEIIGRGSGK